MTQFKHFPLVSLLALGIAMPAMAQNAPAQPASGPQTAPQTAPQDDPDRDVVVVTAQKREETVQDIAVAVTAITGELRDEIGLTTVQDYTNFAPGLGYSTSNDRLSMRGVSRTSNNFGIRSGISNYVDGVYFSSAIPASREPIFVERVEVVRGPQGTLYGRDSIGGALNVISKRPTDEFEGQFNAGFGDYDNLKVETTIAGPITDWLRYRVGAHRSSQGEGFFKNYAGLETEGGRTDDTYVEGQLEGEIGESFDWWIRAGRLTWDVRKGAPGARTGVDSPYPYTQISLNSNADASLNPWFGLSDPARTQVGNQNTNPSITDRYGFNTDFTNYAKLSPTSELAVEAIWHADNFDIRYLGGYVWYNYLLRQDEDNSPIKRFSCTAAVSAFCGGVPGRVFHVERISDYMENRGWFSNEINFLSTWDGPLQIVSGIYQYQENYTQSVWFSNVTSPGGTIIEICALLSPTVPGCNFAPRVELQTGQGYGINKGAPSGGSLILSAHNSALNHAYGAFIQGDYELNDQWKFTAGIRYSTDVMNTREYSRVINHYVLQVLNGLPARVEVTSQLGGPDPSTRSAANPCGFAGQGVVNTNVTPGNSTGCPSGTNADKTRYGIYVDPVTGNSFRDMHADFEEVTGVLGVDWTPDDDTLVFGKYNRGYKPGGLGCAAVICLFNATPFTDKELVDAFELGFKREWRELDLITNLQVFYYDYQGYQVSNLIVPEQPADPTALRPAPFTAYVNLPQVETTGIELETTWFPTDNLRFLFNYGYLNPEIGDTNPLVHALDQYALDPAAQPLGAPAAAPASCPAPVFSPAGSGPASCRGVQGQNLVGNVLPFSPKHKAAINGTYTFDFEDGSTLDASLSYFWQDIAFSSMFNRSYTKIPSWTQADGRLSWTSSDGDITVIGFVRNLFDDIAYDSRGAGGREGGNNQVAPTECFSTPGTTPPMLGQRQAQSCYTLNETLRPPRTWGAELQFRF